MKDADRESASVGGIDALAEKRASCGNLRANGPSVLCRICNSPLELHLVVSVRCPAQSDPATASGVYDPIAYLS